MREKELSAEYINSRLTYDKTLGKFFWKPKAIVGARDASWNSRYAGTMAGHLNSQSGYVFINLDKKMIYEHKLVWFMEHGVWYDGQLDHKDRVRDNNHISNLRLTTPIENSQNMSKRLNTSSKFKGVSWVSSRNKWVSYITINRKRETLGYFSLEIDAALSYNEMALKHFGEYANLNIIEENPNV